MKSQPLFMLFIYSLILFSICSCKKEEENAPANITIEGVSEIVETGFTINWSTNSTDIKSILIEISLQSTFEVIDKEIDVVSTTQTSLVINLLLGATNYYYRIKATLNDGTVVLSKENTVTTGFKVESVSFTTSDGITLAGKLKYLESNDGKNPGIIFMHELNAWGNNWQTSDIVTGLIAQGYVCLILDFRGHFSSDYVPLPTDYSEVEAFINNVSNDLIASIDFMKSIDHVNAEKLALVGGSMGGIMAIAGNGYAEVKTTVALSASQLGIYSIFPTLKIKSAFFIAGENDVNMIGTNFATEATSMFNITEEPKKLKIISGSGDHGTNLLSIAGLNQEIIDWIVARIDE